MAVGSAGAPQNARSRRTVAALLRAARELIEEGGVEALTMAAVAERAGVTRRAVYLHFPSRVSLINGVVEDLKGAGGLDEVLRPVWETADAITMVDQWARCMASLLPRIMPIVRAIQRVSHTDPDAARHWEEATRSRRAACRRLAERLAEEGRLAPPWTVDSAADMMLALISFEVVETLLVHCRWSADRLAEHLAAVFCGTFITPAPRDEPSGRGAAADAPPG